MMRRLRRYLWRRPRALPRWWRMPNQFLLRYETRWALRWLRRPAGIFWLLFPSFFWLLNKGFGFMPWDETMLGYVSSGMYMHKVSIFSLILTVLWVWLMRKRMFLTLSPQRWQDLALTPLQGRHLWPGLMAAPVLIPMAVIVIQFSAFLILPLLIEIIVKLFLQPLTTLVYAMVSFILVSALLALFFVFLFAATTHIASRCHQNPTLVQIAKSCVGYYLLLGFRLLLPYIFIFIGLIVIPASITFAGKQLLPLLMFIAIIAYLFAILIADVSRNIKLLRRSTIAELHRDRLIRNEGRPE